MTRLRRVTTRPSVMTVMAAPPVATTLPTTPGTARIDTDLVTLTVAML
jgi:hypothetical protein